jgi:glucokinase
VNQVIAAVDIGGTNVVYGIVTRKGEILSKSVIPTKDCLAPSLMVEKVVEGLRSQLSALDNPSQLCGVGIGAPNGNYHTGCIEFAPNLNWKGIVPLAALFEEALGVKAVLTNDANAAALGEMIFGDAKGLRDFLFITLGTGLGSGIVANGELIYGHDGLAGELGHVIVVSDGRLCGCGRKGCLETYCSATGLRRTFAEFHGEEFNEQTLSSKEIVQAARAGDEKAQAALDYTAKILGESLANAVAFTSPKTIFLFGGLANAGDLLLQPTKHYFEESVLNIYKNKVEIRLSGLAEDDAALLGAASLVAESDC